MRHRFLYAALMLMLVSACGNPNSSSSSANQQVQQDHSNPNPSPVPAGAKLEKEPRPADESASRGPLGSGAGGLREGQVRTLHLGPGVVTNAKLAVSTVTVNVNATATTGSSAADPTLVGGTILGWYSGGNIDQVIDNIVLNGDGSVTVTLGVAATAQNNIKVVIVRQFGA